MGHCYCLLHRLHHGDNVGTNVRKDEAKTARRMTNAQWESVIVVGGQQFAELAIILLFGKTFFFQYFPQNIIVLKSIKSAMLYLNLP